MDCVAKSFVTGIAGPNSLTQALTFCANPDFNDTCGCTDGDVRTARQQSWLQQPVVWTVR